MSAPRPAPGTSARALLGVSTGLLAVGFAATATALWMLSGTVDAGGADIGGGILALFGTVVGTVGLVLLVVAAVVALVGRRRSEARVSGR